MTAAITLLIAASGSGEAGTPTPDKGPGIALIIGIVIALIVLFALLFTFIARRSRRTTTEHGTHERGEGGVGRL